MRLRAAAPQNGSRGSMAPSQPPKAGTKNEAQSEDHADLAEGRRPLLRRRHVGDVGAGGAEAGRGNARNRRGPRTSQADVGRQRHHDVVEAQAKVGQQHDGPPSNRSESAPWIGEQKNCITAHVVSHQAIDARPPAPYRRKKIPRPISAAPE